jgi:hypothetical protein
MKKAADLNVGDTAIYISGDDEITTSVVVSKPIDDGRERPIFKIGRKDLANGDYLINGSVVYDTTEEANKVLVETLKKRIKHYENEKLIAEGMILVLNNKLKRLSES